jgi:putative restriction endonuclease
MSVDNGIALRADIHRLFDTGYVTVTPDHDFKVSERLFEDFDNGLDYYEMEGDIWVPQDEDLRPDPSYLEWHRDNVFER